jgi:hypothetical protein
MMQNFTAFFTFSRAQSKYWSVPVITAGAMASEYGSIKRKMYPLLTRVGASFNSMAQFVRKLLEHFGWQMVISFQLFEL